MFLCRHVLPDVLLLLPQKRRSKTAEQVMLCMVQWKKAILGAALLATLPMWAQQKATVTVHPEQGKEIISKHIYGQFAEHLGTC